MPAVFARLLIAPIGHTFFNKWNECIARVDMEGPLIPHSLHWELVFQLERFDLNIKI